MQAHWDLRPALNLLLPRSKEIIRHLLRICIFLRDGVFWFQRECHRVRKPWWWSCRMRRESSSESWGMLGGVVYLPLRVLFKCEFFILLQLPHRSYNHHIKYIKYYRNLQIWRFILSSQPSRREKNATPGTPGKEFKEFGKVFGSSILRKLCAVRFLDDGFLCQDFGNADVQGPLWTIFLLGTSERILEKKG